MSDRNPVHVACPFGVAVLAACIAVQSGCSSRNETQTIVESHAVHSQAAIADSQCDLGVDANCFSNTSGVNMLAGDAAVIQPPAAIAVVRVTCGGEKNRPLAIEAMPPERAAMWNQLLGDLTQVREVAVLRTLGMDPRGVAVKDLLRESGKQECNLLLVFSIDESPSSSAAIRGVLWNTATAAALAAFQADVELPQSVVEKCSDDEDMRFHRDCDASYQVEAELRLLVRDTLWDMAAKSTPAAEPESRPNPWKTDEPILPRNEFRRFFMRGGA